MDLRDDHKEGVGWLVPQATPPRSTIMQPRPPSCKCNHLRNAKGVECYLLHERKMAERSPTGGITIPSSGDATPEYNAVRKSYGEINPAIIPGDFVSQAHSCGLIPTRNLSTPPVDVVLNEISRDPVNFYSLQHVIATLNVENRFDKGIIKMENTFQCKDYLCMGVHDLM